MAIPGEAGIQEHRDRTGIQFFEVRVQQFQGTVIQRKNKSTNGETFTVRKISNGVGVERIFPLLSPSIDKIEVLRRGSVKRAKLYYLRGRQGKAARIKEKITSSRS